MLLPEKEIKMVLVYPCFESGTSDTKATVPVTMRIKKIEILHQITTATIITSISSVSSSSVSSSSVSSSSVTYNTKAKGRDRLGHQTSWNDVWFHR